MQKCISLHCKICESGLSKLLFVICCMCCCIICCLFCLSLLALDSTESNEALPVDVIITVENINHIDTEDMIIDTSLKLDMQWRDSRLKFRNLPKRRKKLIKSEISKKLWLPNENLIFIDAILGDTQEDDEIHISAQTLKKQNPYLPYPFFEGVIQ